MSRDALVVGISTYSYGGLNNLEAPVKDAEAIAQCLENSSYPFRIERLPGIKDKANDGLKTGNKTQVSLRQLQKALIRYFKPSGETYSDTVLFYYSGHGLYDELTGKSYLATSDADPEDNKWGYALRDLSELLQDSPVKRQIIWLDCCHSGGLVAVKDANPGEQSGYSRCFVAASQAIESAYELSSGSHGVLTDGLLQGLNPERVPGEWIDTLSLCAFVNQYLKDVRKTYPQRSLFLNVGEPIDLTRIETSGASSQALSNLQVDVCPYRALDAFDFTPEDVGVFFGRRVLTDELLGQIYNHNFLAVLGPSGSGKSSVVRAGLLHELQQGERRSSTETWRILPIIKPGDSPLRSLAGVFIPEELRSKKKGKVFLDSYVEDLKQEGLPILISLIEEEEHEQPIVLVVDQFEEIFTLCRGSQEKEEERKQFLDCLFGAVDALQGNLRLIITLRADFLGKCLEQSYGNLAERIKSNRVDMTPLTEAELDEVICKPAATVGLEVAPYLQQRLKEHIQEAPGSLPLLEYALTELWRDWHRRYTTQAITENQLTFESYDRIGGVAGALENQANAVYESFAESSVKQGLVQRIFLELVQPGEETEDTRRRVLKQELISDVHSEPMIDEVLEKLIAARLIVTDEIPAEDAPGAVTVDLAHEATIRHWKQLRYWLNKHRQDLPLIRQLRADAATWKANQKQPNYLLVGARLDNALECLHKYRKLGYLSGVVQSFVEVSQETWIAEETEKERQILEALCMTSEVQWNRHQQLESLLTITRAGKRLQQILRTRPEIVPDNTQQVIAQLQQTLYGRIQEKNRLESHFDILRSVVYAPDGETIASAGDDSTIKIWNAADGSLIASLESHSADITTITYSIDSKTLASASEDKTVKLWNIVDGKLSTTLEGHEDGITTIAFSPDSKTLASAGWDNTIKIWDVDEGKLITTLRDHNEIVSALSYSPNGKTLASASGDQTVKIWDAAENSLIFTLKGHNEVVLSVKYNPDSKSLSSAGCDNTIKIWSIENGCLLNTLEGHNNVINDINYNQDGKILASASSDKTVRLWNMVDGSLLFTLEGHSETVNVAKFSPDSKTVASVSNDRTIKLWDAKDGALIVTLEGHRDNINSVAYSPDSKTVASASSDKTVRLWNIGDRQLIATLNGHCGSVNSVTYSPDGKTVASASVDKSIKIWDVENRDLIATLRGHDKIVLSLTYSPSGENLASASGDKTIKLWNTENFSCIATLEGHDDMVNSIVYSSENGTIVSASSDHSVKLWNLADNSLLATLDCGSIVNAAAYHPDGTILASASYDNMVNLWNTLHNRVFNLTGHSNVVNFIAYSPNGKVLASASADKTIKLWDMATLSFITTLSGHSDVVHSVAYSPDGRVLASASADKTIKLWDLDNNSLISTLQGHCSGVNSVAYSPDGTILASASNDNTIKLWNVYLDTDLSPNTLMEKAVNWLHNYLIYNPNVSQSDKKLLET